MEIKHWANKWVTLMKISGKSCSFVKYCQCEGLKQMYFGILMFIKITVPVLSGKRSSIFRLSDLIPIIWHELMFLNFILIIASKKFRKYDNFV